MWVTGTLRLLTSIRRFFPSVYIIVNDDRPQSKDLWSKTTRGLYLHLGTCDPLYFFFPKRVYRGWVPSSEGLGGGVSVIESLCLDTLYLDVGR